MSGVKTAPCTVMSRLGSTCAACRREVRTLRRLSQLFELSLSAETVASRGGRGHRRLPGRPRRPGTEHRGEDHRPRPLRLRHRQPPASYVESTRRLVEGLQAQLPKEKCREVLAGNNHGVPRGEFARLRRVYRRPGIDAVLRLRHERLLATLEEHARNGQPWYEQRITPSVVDYVRQNPEIQAGVRRGEDCVTG